MRVASLIVCESANLMPDGRFNILGGGISRVYTVAFPAQVKLAAVMQILAEPSEAGMGPHSVAIRMLNADGKDVMPKIQAKMEIQPGQPDHSIVLDLGYQKFEKPGRYGLSVLIGGREEAHVSIDAILLEKP